MNRSTSKAAPRRRARVLVAALLAVLAGTARPAGGPPSAAGAEVIEARLLPPDVKRQVAALATAATAPQPASASEAARMTRAASLARSLLQRARIEGDPRLTGYARAALAPWWEREDVPPALAVLQATVEQSQHRFDEARQRLERVLARDPHQVQGWLTLSTVRAVQGDLGGAREACRQVADDHPAGARLCELQVQVQTARAEAGVHQLRQLARSADPALAGWAASLAGETLSRLGRHAEAAAWLVQAARSSTELYDALALADAQLAAGQAGQAWQTLSLLPPTDAVLLRRLRASQLAPGHADQTQALRATLQARFDTANDEEEAGRHARERALFALWTDATADARRWATRNLALQKEPIDLRIAAEAALRSGDASLLDEVRRHARLTGLLDHRLQAALQPAPSTGPRLGRDAPTLTP